MYQIGKNKEALASVQCILVYVEGHVALSLSLVHARHSLACS